MPSMQHAAHSLNPALNPISQAIRIALLGMALAAAVGASPNSYAASPQTLDAVATQAYNIPTGPLGRMLASVAVNANIALSFDPALTEGLTRPAMTGSYSPREAFTHLLNGSGLEIVALSHGSYTLRKQVLAAAPAPRKEEDAAVGRELRSVVVRANSERLEQITRGATKTDTPLRDVAQSVQIVNSDQISSLGAQSVKDVLEHVSGVVVGQGEGRREEFYIRGFYSPHDNMVDGMRDDNLYYRDLANVERMEVIKGPAAALNGRGSAGGVINRVTKMPLADQLLEVNLSAGSNNLRRETLDVGGLLGDNIKSRLNIAHQSNDSFRDIIHGERTMVAPALSMMLTPSTELLLQAEWQKENRTPDRGQPAINGMPVDVPARNFYGEAFDYTSTESKNTKIRVEHIVNDSLNLSNTLIYSQLDLEGMNTRNRGISPDGKQVRRQVVYFPQQQTNLINQSEAVWKINTGTLSHTLLAGLEVSRQERDVLSRSSANGFLVDILNPAHVLPKPNPSGLTATVDANFKADTLALYLQDQMILSPHWKAQAGMRFDRFDQQQIDHLKSNALSSRVDSTLSPRAGLVYQPTEQQSYYLTLSRSYQPVGNDLLYTGTGARFDTVKPLQTDLQEIGVKHEWLDRKMSATLALYRLTQKNQLTTDPSDSTRQVQVGEQRSEGLELDVSGKLSRNLRLMASYTRVNAQVTASNDISIPVGNRPEMTPSHSASVWLDQYFENGWGVAGGLVHFGSRFALTDNTVRLPSYTRYDMAVYYRHKAFETRLKVTNLSDVRYSETANNNVQISPGAPRNLMLEVKYLFR